jgi:ubiquinone/menaquinone biosynthesis C-methylase UbiE
MGHHDNVHKFDPANAARLDDPQRRQAMPPGLLAAALALKPGDKVADIGCGTGYWLIALLGTSPPGVHFSGVDSEPAMLAHLAQRLRGHARGDQVTPVLSTEHQVPLANGSVDVVVMGAVYHELADRRGFLREIRRLLVPGGRLAIIDWDDLPPGVERTMGPPIHERVPFALARTEVMAEAFEDIDSIDGFSESYCLVARKAASSD